MHLIPVDEKIYGVKKKIIEIKKELGNIEMPDLKKQALDRLRYQKRQLTKLSPLKGYFMESKQPSRIHEDNPQSSFFVDIA